MLSTEINKILLGIVDDDTAKPSFVHSLALSYRYKCELDILDMRGSGNKLGVREYLEKWKLLPENSPQSGLTSIGMKIKKIIKRGNKINIIKNRINKYSYDLLVVGCRGSGDKKGIFGNSLSSYIFNSFENKILFVPNYSRPFIEDESGNISLQRVILLGSCMSKDFLFSPMAFLFSFLEVFKEIKIELIFFNIDNFSPSSSFYPVQHPQIIHCKEILVKKKGEKIGKKIEEYCGDLLILRRDNKADLGKDFFEELLKNLSCPLFIF